MKFMKNTLKNKNSVANIIDKGLRTKKNNFI